MLLTNKSVLITGGTGTFGHAFAERALRGGARRVVIVSRDEKKQADMAALFGDSRLRFFIGDVCDRARMVRAMRDVDIVVHAAAMKRVETCEDNPAEAIRTNVMGTMAVADACILAGVQTAVFLSTDKAAAPVTLYGASKLSAERLWIRSNAYAAGTGTRLMATRYGNVLGSRGSAVEVWRAQAAAGKPLTVTDHRMTRFWMTTDDAVELVLLAIRNGRGGEVFIPKCGAASILRVMHAATSYEAGQDALVTGIRRGEKLHEMLVCPDEARYTVDRGTHYVILPNVTWEDPGRSVEPAQPEGWTFTSDTAHQLTIEDLRAMMGGE